MATKINILENNNDILNFISLDNLLQTIVAQNTIIPTITIPSKITIYIIIGLYYSGVTFISNLTNKILTMNTIENTVFVPNATIETNVVQNVALDKKQTKYSIKSNDYIINPINNSNNIKYTINTKIGNIENIILTFNDQSIHIIKQTIDNLITNTTIRCKYLFVFRNATDIVHIRTQETLNILKKINPEQKKTIKEENVQTELNKLKKLHDKIKKNLIYYLQDKTSFYLSVAQRNMYNIDNDIYDKLLKTIITNDIIQNYRENIIYYTLYSNTIDNNITKNKIEQRNTDSFDFTYFENTSQKIGYINIVLTNFLHIGKQPFDTTISNNIQSILTTSNILIINSRIEQCILNKSIPLNKTSNYLRYNNIKNMESFKAEFKVPKRTWFQKKKDKFKYLTDSIFTTKYNNLRGTNNILKKVIKLSDPTKNK